MLDPERASLLGRIGAHRLHATHDSRAVTAPARSAFLARFEREVDPDRVLPPDERARRARHARAAYFARLALARHDAGRGPKASPDASPIEGLADGEGAA